MKNYFKWFLVSLVIAVLTACGGGGSNNSNDGKHTKNLKVLDGKFNNVKGLSYKTSSGISGITDKNGYFKYRKGDNITFNIDELEIGTIKAKSEVDIYDFHKPALLLQVLYSLDKDSNPDNGIQLNTETTNSSARLYTNNRKNRLFKQENVRFVLDDIDPIKNKQFIKFLKVHNANVVSKNEAIAHKIFEDIGKIIHRNGYKHPKDTSTDKDIFFGKFVPLRAYLNERKNFDKIFKAKYQSKDYNYRVNTVVLNNMYNAYIYKIKGLSEDTLKKDEILSKQIDDTKAYLSFGLNNLLQIKNDILEGKFSKIEYLLSGVEPSIDLSNLDNSAKEDTKFVYSLLKDCATNIKSKELDTCLVNSAKYGYGKFIDYELKETHPIFATVLNDGGQRLMDAALMWKNCYANKDLTLSISSLKSIGSKCIDSIATTAFNNIYDFVSTVYKFKNLKDNLQEVNEWQIALEKFMATKIVQPSEPCKLIKYYKNKDYCTRIGLEAQNKNLVNAIANSSLVNVTDINFLSNYNYENVMGDYNDLIRKYDNLFNVVNARFKKYQVNNQVLDSEINDYINKYVDFNIDKIETSTIKNKDNTYNINLNVCISLKSNMYIKGSYLKFEIKGIGEDNFNKTIDMPNEFLKEYNYCENFELKSKHSLNESSKPYIVFAKLDYNVYKEGNYKTYSIDDQKVLSGRLVKGEKNDVDIIVNHDKNNNYTIYAANINDIRANSSGKYIYNWKIQPKDKNCEPKIISGEDSSYINYNNSCNSNFIITLTLYDSNDYSKVLKKVKEVDLLKEKVNTNDEQKVTILNNTISLKNGDRYSFTPVIKNYKSDYYIQYIVGDNLINVKRNGLQIEFTGENNTNNVINSDIQIDIYNKNNTLLTSKDIKVTILPSSKPLLNKKYINYSYRYEKPLNKNLRYINVKKGSIFHKEWGLYNDTDKVINGVFLKLNQDNSSNIPLPQRIDLGDIQPYSIAKNQSIDIDTNNLQINNTYFGYYEVYYTKDDGSFEKLYYRNGKPASVVFKIKVVKQQKAVEPLPIIIIKNIGLYENDLKGVFWVSQKNNRISKVEVDLSEDKYFNDLITSMNLDSGSGIKDFTYNLKQFVGKRVYWRIKAYINDNLYSTINGNVYVKELVKNPPQHFTVIQTSRGALLSWDAIDGAYSYTPLASLNFKADGAYADITGGCEFISETSCLIDKSRFYNHKVWYFKVKADNSKTTNPVKFVWQDKFDSNNKYMKYLAGKTLYLIKNSGISKFEFNSDLTKVRVLTPDKTLNMDTQLTNNGLKILSESNNRYLVIKQVTKDYLLVEYAQITDDGIYLEHGKDNKLFFKLPEQTINLNTLLVGKTFYVIDDDKGTKYVHPITFSSDGTFIDRVKENGKWTTLNLSYTIEGNSFIVENKEKNKFATFVKETSDYLEFSAQGEIVKLYKNQNSAEAELTNNNNLSKLIVGKTYYIVVTDATTEKDGKTIPFPHIEKLKFNSDGTFVDSWMENNSTNSHTFNYEVKGDILRVYGVNDEGSFDKNLEFIKKDNIGLHFNEKTLYYSESLAKKYFSNSDNATNDNMKIKNLVSGHFDFVDEQGNSINNIPSNLWVRITPKDNQIDGNWQGVNCKIDSNGNFGEECYIHSNEEDIRSKFSSSYGKTYQVIIYKETTSDTHYNKNEEQYGHIKKEGSNGYDVSYGEWRNAIVEVFSNNTTSYSKYNLTGNYVSNALSNPKSGDVFENGKSFVIRWNKNSLRGNYVDLYILHDSFDGNGNIKNIVESKNWYKIASHIRNTGSYGVETSTLQANGNVYKILIVSNNGDWDISDGFFSVVDKIIHKITIDTPTPSDGKVAVDKKPIFEWISHYDGDKTLEYFVEVGEEPNKLVYNSNWITSKRISWSNISNKSLKPNTTYYWRVIAREKGRKKDYYGGEYPKSNTWHFTTTSVSPDLAITNVVMLDTLKPNDTVRFRVTVKNLGSQQAEPENIQISYKKDGVVYPFERDSIYTLKKALKPGESEDIIVKAMFRDRVIQRDGQIFDNVLKEGTSYIIFDMPTISKNDFNKDNNKYIYTLNYQDNGDKPKFQYFSIGYESIYNGTSNVPFRAFIGKILGGDEGIVFEVTDDFKVTKAEIYYRLSKNDNWHLIKTITNNDDDLDTSYKWTIPNDKNFITNSLQIMIKAYDNKNNVTQEISKPLPVYDNTLDVSLNLDKDEFNIGDTFNLNLYVNEPYKERLLEVFLSNNGHTEEILKKVNLNGFDASNNYQLKIPNDNKFASNNVELKVKVVNIHGISKVVTKTIKIKPKLVLNNNFKPMVDLYNRQYNNFPSDARKGSSSTHNSVVKVILDDDNVVHALIASVASWWGKNDNEPSRNFQYYYVTYNINNEVESNPIKIEEVKQINNGNLPDESYADFILTKDKIPIVATFNDKTKEVKLFFIKNGQVTQQKFNNEHKDIDNIKLVNFNGKTFLTYRDKTNANNYVDYRIKAVEIYPHIGTIHNIVNDEYIGYARRVEGNVIFSPWKGEAYRLNDNLQATNIIFNIGEHKDYVVRSDIKSYNNKFYDFVLEGETLYLIDENGNKIMMQKSVKDSHYFKGTNRIALDAYIYNDYVLLIRDTESKRWSDYKISKISLIDGSSKDIVVPKLYDGGSSLHNYVDINKNGWVVIANPDESSAYIMFGNFK